MATVVLDPPDAAANANWFNVTDWQGGNGTWGGGVEGLVISQLRQVEPGVYRTDRSFPVGGKWKALIRLHTGDSIEAVPVFLPRDPAIPAPEVPATARPSRGRSSRTSRSSSARRPAVRRCCRTSPTRCAG